MAKRRVEAAVAALGPAHPVDVVWRPFELNPDLPPGGVDRAEYRIAKFGSLERSRELEDRVQEAARPDGIVFAFGRIRRTPGTFAAHRLLDRARRRARQDPVAEALFRAYFQEGLDIGDRGVLDRIARDAGLDPAFLDGDEGVADLRAEQRDGLALGIQGVPFLVIDRRWALSGAQPADRILRAVLESRSGSGGVQPGDGA